MKLKNLSFDNIKKDAEGVLKGADNTYFKAYPDCYLKVYPEFLGYFERIKETGKIERHHLVISSHFVYGWMPTIMYLDLKTEELALKYLNAALKGYFLKSKELEVLKKTISGSMVGLSKLLHFVNPREYAIWDRRVFRYLTGARAQYGIENADMYLDYLAGMKKITEHEAYPALHEKIEKHFEYPLHPMRAIEIVMFETDRIR